MHNLNISGGIFFNQRDAENRNRHPARPIGDSFQPVGLAVQNTLIGWTVMLASEIPKTVPT